MATREERIPMNTVAVIGANGQVASEVCLHLSARSDVRVVPICRTELGSAFLRRCGLPCRIGSLARPEEARSLLEDCDLVVDLALPSGQPSEIRKVTTTLVTNALDSARPGARYVYGSTIMAFGMAAHHRRLRRHLVAHTGYGTYKRRAERLARRLGRRTGHDVFVLRLGEVHGELQAVSRNLRRRLREDTAFIPDAPSYSVFAFSIAEALVNIAAGREAPGTYTLVSAPEWSYRDLYEYHCRIEGVEPRVVLVPFDAGADSGVRAAGRSLVSTIARVAIRNRELFAGHLLAWLPGPEQRAAAIHYTRRARAEITASVERGRFRPFEGRFAGRSPGPRLANLSDSRTTMPAPAREVRRIIAGALESPPS